ncbi:MAG: hypothetical protein ACHQII_01930 [Bacteroidia bacterium]
MKIFLSIVTLGALAFIIHKLGAKKIVQEIEDKFSTNHTSKKDDNTEAQKQELIADTKTVAELEAANKDLLDRIKKLQDANKWGVKDDKGFYYSVDSKGEIFSGDNSSDEYEVMEKQLADYNAKKDELTKKIAAETPAQKQSLELPLAVKAIIESIKLKFSHKSSLDENGDEQNDDGQNQDEQNSYSDNENNYGNGNYSDGGGYGGGGGAMPYVSPFPPLTPAQAAIISPAIVAPVTAITPTPLAAPFTPPHFHFNPRGIVFNNPLHVTNNTGATARMFGFRRR